MPHPCLSCGACCAAFVVAFHWSEAEPRGESHAESQGIPVTMTERLDAHRLAMRGTWARRPRCVALQGAIGVAARCAIYAQRPEPCRALPAAWEHGAASPQCDKARALHGLPPLAPADWSA
jgi:Fe-S-cluster containining protein